MDLRQNVEADLRDRGLRDPGGLVDTIMRAYEETLRDALRAQTIADTTQDFPDLALTYGPCERVKCLDPQCVMYVNGVEVCSDGRKFIEVAAEKGLALKWPVLWNKIEELASSPVWKGLRESFLPAALQILNTLPEPFRARVWEIFPDLSEQAKRIAQETVPPFPDVLVRLLGDLARAISERRSQGGVTS